MEFSYYRFTPKMTCNLFCVCIGQYNRSFLSRVIMTYIPATKDCKSGKLHNHFRHCKCLTKYKENYLLLSSAVRLMEPCARFPLNRRRKRQLRNYESRNWWHVWKHKKFKFI